MNYYNENEPYAAQWLRNLIKQGLIPDGEVDSRSIVDVQSDELREFAQCHFFAGIGGWSHALRLAGWADDRQVWTGSCPCQPFSVAGKGLGADDPRHLWPHFHRLIAAVRPPVVFGEQVSGAAGYGWLDGVRSDLAREDYACEGFDIPACAVDAPHIRQRLYWVATNMGNANSAHGEGGSLPSRIYETNNNFDGRGSDSNMADASEIGRRRWPASTRQQARPDAGVEGSYRSDMADADNKRRYGFDALLRPDADGWNTQGFYEAAGSGTENGTFWSDAIWLTGADGKARRAQPGLPLLAHGISGRVGRLRAYGNAIVPQLAAEMIGAFMDCEP